MVIITKAKMSALSIISNEVHQTTNYIIFVIFVGRLVKFIVHNLKHHNLLLILECENNYKIKIKLVFITICIFSKAFQQAPLL